MKKKIFAFAVGDLVESDVLVEKLLEQIELLERGGGVDLLICVNGGHRLIRILKRAGCEFHYGPSGYYFERNEDIKLERKFLDAIQVKLILKLEKVRVNARIIIPVVKMGDMQITLPLGCVVEIIYRSPCKLIVLFVGRRDYRELAQRYSGYAKIRVVEIG